VGRNGRKAAIVEPARQADPSFPLLIRQTWPGDALRLTGEGQYRVILVLQGALVDRERPERIAEHHLILAPPWAEAELAVVTPCRLLQLEFPDRFLEHTDFDPWRSQIARLFPRSSGSAPAAPVEVLPLPADIVPGVRLTLSQMLREQAEKGRDHPAMIRLKLIELFLLLERAQTGPADVPSQDGPAGGGASVEPALAHIQAHYGEELSLPGLAGLCGLSPTYFSRLFRQKAGIPVFAFINRLRVRKACSLLKKSDASILEVALSVGYNNVSFFNRYFRRVMNMSPREYRRLLRQ
jgi:AraC-like DNA-binding protein